MRYFESLGNTGLNKTKQLWGQSKNNVEATLAFSFAYQNTGDCCLSLPLNVHGFRE